jgi:hypothetical protein
MRTLLTFTLTLLWLTTIAQTEKKSVVIGAMTSKSNALLIVNPPNPDQGVLLPQLTSEQRNLLKPVSPSEDGLIVFDITDQSYYYWTTNGWARLGIDGRQSLGGESFNSIDPADFQILRTDKDVRHDNLMLFETDNNFVTVNRREDGEQIIAPVNIPDRSVLSELSVYYMDAHSNNIKVSLLRKSLSAGSELLVAWETSGASFSVNTQSFTSFYGKEVIDLANYTYRVVIEFDLQNDEVVDSPGKARQRIYGVRIKYQQ